MKLSNFVKLALPSAVLALGLISTPASATNSSTTLMSVNASVAAFCTISAGPLAFGAISNPTAAITTSTTISYKCNTGTTVAGITFTTSAFSPPATTFGMAGATNGGTLAYSLNLSSTGAIPVTSGTEILSSSTLTFTANGTQQSLPVYGQITQAAAAAAAADSYTDSVTVTFTY